jgi:hypothetical protein
MTFLSRAGYCALVAGVVGVLGSGPSSAAGVALDSASGGVYKYDIILGSNEDFFYGSIVLSGLSGVTDASVADTIAMYSGTGAVFTTTTATFTINQSILNMGASGPMGTMIVDSTVLTEGTVDYVIHSNGSDVTGTVWGPVAGNPNGAPEPSTWAMMGLGFAGLGFFGYRKARSARITASA